MSGPRHARLARRLAAFLAAVSLIASVSTVSVLAVHNTGIFQMDGDAQTSLDSTPTALEDWDLICKANPDTCTFQAGYPVPAGTTTATVSSHESDGVAQSIFTGGGSKDGQDIPNWKWKNGSVPDKDELLHAFAARYSTTPSATCPVTAGQTTCELLYFGSDRFDNSGDATQAFWFFQNRITLNANGTFNGVHRDGDLLIISEFSNGGTTSTITVYKWLNGAAVFVAGGPNQKCTPAGATDPFCGIVNPADGTVAPWTYTDKDGNTSYLQGDLYEAGINLSDPSINLGGECFSSFAAESRSSTSLTSVLKDFVLGEFAVCGATITTTPSAGAGGEVSPGTSVTDLAVVQGTGLANPPTPTGDVTFSICGPTAVNSTALCTSGGTQVGSPVALANSAPPPGEASATSAAVNTAGSPLAPGRYCFRADWPGDSNYQGGPFTHAGTGNSECFIVRQIPTTTVTTPSDGSGTALVSPVALGTALFDKAVVTGTAAGGTPTGTVDFFLCNPTQVTGAAGAEVCATGGTNLSGNPRTLVADAGSSPPSASVLSSPGVNANMAGVWCFRAVYTPTGSTYLGSSDATHGECVTVSKAPTTTVTTPRVDGVAITGPVPVGTDVTDYALVTGSAADGTPTGTINFFICNPTQTTGAPGAEVCATGGTAAGSKTAAAVAGSSPPKSDATSDPVDANLVGVWCFRAEYVPGGANGGNYTGSSDASHSECFLVQDSTSATSAQDWLPNDSATITSAGDTNLNGTVVFTLHASADCTGAAIYTEPTITLTNADSPVTRATTNTTFKVSASTTVSWKTVFTPAAGSNVTGTTKCETTTLTINNNP